MGNYIPYLDIPFAPLIGGILAGYVVGGGFRNGIINGGLAAGIPGFIYTIIVIIYIAESTIFAAVTNALASTSYTGLAEIITVLSPSFRSTEPEYFVSFNWAGLPFIAMVVLLLAPVMVPLTRYEASWVVARLLGALSMVRTGAALAAAVNE